VLIGREAETQAIDRLVAGSRIGNSGVLAITGEPGVGKTALLDYGRSRLEGFRPMTATGTEPEREIPFAGLQALLRPALDLLDRIPGPQADALSAALALRSGPVGDRFAIGAATLSLVCRYAEEAPLAVLVDDLHLWDRPSAEALAFAARRLSADPIALLVAARTGEAEETIAGLPRLVLAGLDPEAARSLVGATSRSPVTDEQLDRLYETTGGNPLALLELGVDPGLLDPVGPGLPAPVPATLVSAYARRVRLLDEAARSALLVAVVCDGDRRVVTAACARLGTDPTRLAAAEQEGLVTVTGGRIEFRHPLLRAAVYGDATVDERRAAHRAAAEVLPGSDEDRRAWHLSEATWTPDASVAAMLTATAERAAERTAYAVASTAYERAARLSPETGQQLGLLVSAAGTAWSAGLGPRATRLLDELRGLPLPDWTTTAVLQLRAAIAARTGSLSEALDILEQAAARAPSADAAVPLLADAVSATFYLADTTALRRLAGKLTEALREVTTPYARAVGLMATGIAEVLTGQGGAARIRAAATLLTESPELRSDPRRLPWLMLPPLYLRDSDTAGAELRAVVDEVRDRAGVGTLPYLLFHIARDQATTSSWRRAEANYAEAIRLSRETGQSTELAVSLAGLAWLESRQGREAGCRAHAAEALPICSERSIRLGEAWVLFALGDLELGLGDAAAAVDHLERLEELLGRLGLGDPDLSPRPELTDALLRLGREEEARLRAQEYWDAAVAKGQPWACARAQRALGLVAGPDDFDAPFGAALELHGDTLDDFETARTLLAYGGRLRRAGRRVDARPPLRRALETFATLGSLRWADQSAAELDATGERVPRRETTGVESLTPQELQVSLLLAEGRSTREAAAALFLSPKTVEYHLRKVYTKLGIRSRAELAGLLPH
jgi:DNA-binding CsgD family transcriptional regulator/tetratricopeptide (TPR) repeat protein